MAKASFNDQCIQCHSLGYQMQNGFSNPHQVHNLTDPKLSKKFWDKTDQIYRGIESMRKLTSQNRLKLAQKMQKLNQEFKIERNFMNVQCMNCHQIHNDHPFELNAQKTKNRQQVMKDRCLTCHTKDQVPEWYDRKSGELKEDLFKQKWKQIACPLQSL